MGMRTCLTGNNDRLTSSGFVDQAHAIEAGDFGGIKNSTALEFVVVDWHGNDTINTLASQSRGAGHDLFQLNKQHRIDLDDRYNLAFTKNAAGNANSTVRQCLGLKERAREFGLDLGVGKLAPNQSLQSANRVLEVSHLLKAGRLAQHALFCVK